MMDAQKDWRIDNVHALESFTLRVCLQQIMER